MNVASYKLRADYAPRVESRCQRIGVALARVLAAVAIGLILGAALSSCAGPQAKDGKTASAITVPARKRTPEDDVPPENRHVHYIHIVHDYPQVFEWIQANATGGYNLYKSKGKTLPASNPITGP